MRKGKGVAEDANLAKLNESQREKFIEVLIAYIGNYQKDIETLVREVTRSLQKKTFYVTLDILLNKQSNIQPVKCM